MQKRWFSISTAHQGVLAVAGLLMLLVVAESLLLTTQGISLHLPLDSREAAFLSTGLHEPEQDRRGGYRWTTGDAEIVLPSVGQGRLTVLTLQLGPTFRDYPVNHFTLNLDGRPVGTIAVEDEPRRYLLLVPDAALQADSLRVRLHSDTATVPPDTRAVGLRIEQVALAIAGSSVLLPAPLFILYQSVLIVCCALLLARLSVPLLPALALLLLCAAGLVLLSASMPLLALPYILRWGVALVLLVLLTYALLPLAERQLEWLAPPPLVRMLWAIALLACAVRLAGSLHPLFQAFDLGLNVGRFLRTAYGELVITSRSLEFRNNITVYPPGAYMVLLPGALVGLAPPLLIQASLALIDGFGALAVALLARMLGASSRTTVFSALLYAAIPIHLTALWFGLTAQIFGQALMAPLAVVLLAALRFDERRAWLAVWLLLSVALLTHIGVAIVAVAWLGLVWLLLRWRQAVARAVWWRFAGIAASSGLVSVIGIYGAVALLKLEQFLLTAERVQQSDYTPSYWLMFRAFQISFHEAGFVLLLPGLLLLWRRRLPRGGAALVGGWLGAVLVFLVIEMLTALQVRYIYFLTPLACIAIGLLLDAFARRSQSGRVAAWLVVLLLLVQGGITWYTAAAEDLMMSMSPLLR